MRSIVDSWCIVFLGVLTVQLHSLAFAFKGNSGVWSSSLGTTESGCPTRLLGTLSGGGAGHAAKQEFLCPRSDSSLLEAPLSVTNFADRLARKDTQLSCAASPSPSYHRRTSPVKYEAAKSAANESQLSTMFVAGSLVGGPDASTLAIKARTSRRSP